MKKLMLIVSLSVIFILIAVIAEAMFIKDITLNLVSYTLPVSEPVGVLSTIYIVSSIFGLSIVGLNKLLDNKNHS